jgi:hypothetical protein
MPKGPNGEKRPADAIGLAVLVGRITTGEIEDDGSDQRDKPADRKEKQFYVNVRVATD